MSTRPYAFVLALVAVIALCGADGPQSSARGLDIYFIDVTCGGAVAGAAGRQASARGLDIYFIDVMGGAATLVVTPERESILIDSGWPGLEDRDPKRIEHVVEEVAGLDHLDHL